MNRNYLTISVIAGEPGVGATHQRVVPVPFDGRPRCFRFCWQIAGPLGEYPHDEGNTPIDPKPQGFISHPAIEKITGDR
jgi:hypothetical protein